MRAAVGKTEAPRALWVSDLDGTLLGETYEVGSARPALAALAERRVPVLLVSSKTRAEMEPLCRTLKIEGPFIVENGGAAYWAGSDLPPSHFAEERVTQRSDPHRIAWGAPYPEVVAAFRRARDRAGAAWRGFSDAGVDEIAERTGLSIADADRARRREFDEPFWIERPDSARDRAAFDLLESEGWALTRGGRFYHLMRGCDKGRAVDEILRLYRRGGELPAGGIGDAENDLPFLRKVDRCYIVAGPGGDYDSVLAERLPEARRVAPAPDGWAEAVYDFLSWLEASRTGGPINPPES